MTKREDGKATRMRLLNAACDVFAQKGYRSAKVADICKRADANAALVSYYFGDKDTLYKEAWLHALKSFGMQFFPESASGSPQDQLRDYIQTLIRNFSAGNELARFSRLYLRELVNPTGLIQDAWHKIIEPQRRKLHKIISDILGPAAGALNIRFCELSIVSQCRIFVSVKRNDLEIILGEPLDTKLIERFADHIAEFSLAGIRAVGRSGGR
jgi:TetR/AcrR family transcriptional regulator, regulator of cefoperazone and chloramphenicol sensitivity